jgi:hypothetical protein
VSDLNKSRTSVFLTASSEVGIETCKATTSGYAIAKTITFEPYEAIRVANRMIDMANAILAERGEE